MEKKIIGTDAAPAPIGPYNQAVQFGNMLFISGQIALDPKTGELVQGAGFVAAVGLFEVSWCRAISRRRRRR